MTEPGNKFTNILNKIIMEALKHLNALIAYKSVFVPVELVEPIVTAAFALGVVVCGGAFSDDYKQKVLYIA